MDVATLGLPIALFVSALCSQGRWRYSVAGVAVVPFAIATAAHFDSVYGVFLVGVLHAGATFVAWNGLLPAPKAIRLVTALVGGMTLALALGVALAIASLSTVGGAIALSVFLTGAEHLSASRSPYGEWGLLAHSQTSSRWALRLARFSPVVVGAVLALFGAGIGFWYSTGSIGCLALAIAVVGVVGIDLWRETREGTDDHALLNVVGLIEDSDELFARHIGDFVSGKTLDDAWWLDFAAAADSNLRGMAQRTKNAAEDGAQLVVWAEGAGMVSTEFFDEALLHTCDATRDAQCVTVASWIVLCRTSGTLSNFATIIERNGNVVARAEKRHPVPGPESRVTRTASSGTAAATTTVGRLAIAICFDADHPDVWADLAATSPSIVVVPASDWPTIGVLHSDMARMRVRSAKAALVRVARHGVSAAVHGDGRVAMVVDHRESAIPDLRARLLHLS